MYTLSLHDALPISRAEESVHDQARFGDFTACLFPIFAGSNFLNFGSRLLETREVFRRISRNGILSREKIHDGFQTLLLEKPCRDEHIAAVIPLAAKNGRVTRGQVAIGRAKELKKSGPRVLHELQAGDAVALRCERVHLAH